MGRVYFATEGGNGTSFTQDDRNLEVADTINGLAQKNARTWQIIALISLASFFISLGILIYAVNLPKTVPIVVTVNPEGEAVYAGRITGDNYGNTSVPDIAKEYQIKRLLRCMHQWIIDREAQQAYVREALALVQQAAINELDTFFRSNNPFRNLGERTKSIVIEPPLKQTEKTWVVYFTTTEKNRSGYETKSARYSALINLDFYEPSLENPLGIYITNFDIKHVEEQKL